MIFFICFVFQDRVSPALAILELALLIMLASNSGSALLASASLVLGLKKNSTSVSLVFEHIKNKIVRSMGEGWRFACVGQIVWEIKVKEMVVAHTFTPSAQKAEAGGSLSSTQPGLHREFQDSQVYTKTSSSK